MPLWFNRLDRNVVPLGPLSLFSKGSGVISYRDVCNNEGVALGYGGYGHRPNARRSCFRSRNATARLYRRVVPRADRKRKSCGGQRNQKQAPTHHPKRISIAIFFRPRRRTDTPRCGGCNEHPRSIVKNTNSAKGNRPDAKPTLRPAPMSDSPSYPTNLDTSRHVASTESRFLPKHAPHQSPHQSKWRATAFIGGGED